MIYLSDCQQVVKIAEKSQILTRGRDFSGQRAFFETFVKIVLSF